MDQNSSQRHLFIFNPDCELAIANGSKYYMPSANIVQMANDLAFLPAYLGQKGDCVLLKKLPNEAFRETIRLLNIQCQGILENEMLPSEVKIGEAWGQSPKMNHWLKQHGLGEEWKPEQKEWASRKTAREVLKALIERISFLETNIIPSICYSISEIESRIKGGKYIVKAPWSSSGKGLLNLENRVEAKEGEWLRGMLRRQGYLMLEERLEKIQDIAMEFRATEKTMKFMGWSWFKTGSNGEYRGNYIGPQTEIEQKLIQYLGEEKINLLKQVLPSVLKEILPCYLGYLGVDMMIYRNRAGDYCIQPCIEINLRCNMGIIALFLSERYLADETVGGFTIDFYAGKGEALAKHKQHLLQHPLVCKNNRILSGYLNLTPVDETTHFVASVICD